ncbi:uncharacterized protein LOC100009932 isoform X4 [Monodelphis domestica]|uniref:uncharacterized protein LOC100009932 isoform X4 n=1 Tax=Monodelphis domestica TaxID=13616 RepID=UPI0024E22622|nr:uncharacterized protein LOC100009932 isoform X4 [Monodelphis domestica]
MEELQQMDSLGLLCCLYREPGVPEMTFERDGLPAQEIWSLPAPSLSGLRVSPRLPLPTRTFISGTSFHFKISALCALPWAPLGGGDVPGCGCGLHPGGVAPPVPFPEGAVQGGDAGECPEPALCGMNGLAETALAPARIVEFPRREGRDFLREEFRNLREMSGKEKQSE